MKQAKPNLLRLIFLTIGVMLLTWINLWSSIVAMPICEAVPLLKCIPLGTSGIEISFRTASSAIAQTSLIPAPSVQDEQPINLLTTDTTILPDEVKTAVFNDAVKRTSRTVSQMQIVKAQPQQWSDGCLGLGKPEEICIQAIAPGWQVTVTDSIRNWIYRTDETGNIVRLEQ